MIRDLWIRFLAVLNVISAIAVFLMALWITADVVARFAFDRPIAGTTELVKSTLAAIVFLAIPYALQKGRHVGTTVVLQLLSPVSTTICRMGASIIGTAIFAMICRYSWDPAWSGFLIREYEGVQLHVPVYPVRFLVVLGSGLVSLQFLINLLQELHELRGLLRERT